MQRASPEVQRASSSVIASLLQVALVIVFATGMSAGVWVVFGTQTASPQAAFEFTFTDTPADDALIVRHTAGDRIPGEQLYLTVSGATPGGANGRYQWSGSGLAGGASVTAGAIVMVNATTVGDGSVLDLDDAIVRVVWRPREGNRSSVFARWSGPGSRRVTPTPAVTSTATATGTPTATATPAPTPTSTPTPTAADQVTTVDGSADTGEGTEIIFQISTQDTVTVERFAVETRRTLSGVDYVDRPTTAPELVIENGGDDGHARASSGAGYPTGGSMHSLNTTATITAGNTADVNLGQFSTELETVDATDEASADVTLTLVFADGSRTEIHFAVQTAD